MTRTLRSIPVLVLLAVLGGGCASGPPPLDVAELGERDPKLLEIRDALTEIVEAAHADPERSWFSGWVGNALVNVGGDGVYGCCYHWQELVYFDIKDDVERLGWGISGIEINCGTSHEHHAVLVWDPTRITESAALAAPRTEPVYVLDAWRRGHPDIYSLADWLLLPRPDETPLAYEDLDALDPIEDDRQRTASK